MRKHLLAIAAVGAICAAPPLHTAHASNLKTFLRNGGNDGSSCADPVNACQTLAAALGKTTPGGEITILDAGDYSTSGITITQSVTIDNDGVGEASIRAPGGVGMTISAAAGDVVILRGLTFEGDYTGTTGLTFNTGVALRIENCVFRNWQGGANAFGLFFKPQGNDQLSIINSGFFNNGSSGNSGGIFIGPAGTGSATVVLDRIHLDFNTTGLFLDTAVFTTGGNGISAELRESVVSSNTRDGALVFTFSGSPAARLLIDRSSLFSNGGNGVFANGPHAIAALTGSTISRNGTGVNATSGGQIISYGDNKNNFNIGAEGAATSTLSAF